MTEAEIRRVLDHLRNVRDRWSAATGDAIRGDYVGLEPDTTGIEFQEISDLVGGYIPWLAFTDPDQAIVQAEADRAEELRQAAAARKDQRREAYEALRAEFEVE